MFRTSNRLFNNYAPFMSTYTVFNRTLFDDPDNSGAYARSSVRTMHEATKG
jgi:hypothetical protein